MRADPSDEKRAEGFDDRALFWPLWGFARQEATRECTAFVHFRRWMLAHDLNGGLFEAVIKQRQATAIAVKTASLVDVAIAATSTDDDEGQWARHKGRPKIQGFTTCVDAALLT